MASTINASTTLGLISTADTSGVLQLQTANTAALTINASQNVGVGTASPANKLHVNGTGDSGRFQGTSRSLYIATDTNASAIWNGAGQTGEGVYLNAASNQLDLYTNSTVKVRIDASGNLGLGVTPSASTLSGIIEGGYGTFGLTSSIGVALAGNAYYNSGWKYKASSTATLQLQDSGGFKWNVAASGTAGNTISFTQAMTLDASGNLGVGATSITPRDSGSRTLELYGTSSGRAAIKFTNPTSGTGATDGMFLGYDDNLNFSIVNNESGVITFGTSNTERARIGSDGNVGIGTTTLTNGRLSVTQPVSTNVQYFVNSNATTVYGIQIYYSARTANSVGEEFIYSSDTGGQRFSARSNGGLANYSANNVNLSDRREKTNFAPATSYLDKICAIPVQTFNYIDQNMETDGGLTLGVVAQDVQAVAPELVMESNWANRDDEPKMRLSIYQTDLQYALMKCIQEQQAIIQSLKARLDAANL